MTEPTFEVRLDGPEADGEVRLATLAALAAVLQELEARIGRLLDERSGPGRTPRAIEDLTELRLVGLHRGTTRLPMRRGAVDALDIDLALGRQIDQHFAEIIEALGAAVRPAWTNSAVAESARRLVVALQRAAPRVSFAFPNEPDVSLVTGALRAEVWRAAADVVHEDQAAVVGALEAVDLRNSQFRIRDDVGYRIPMKAVVDAEAVAPFIGRRVRATGRPVRDITGELKSLEDVVIVPVSLPREWLGAPAPSLPELIRESSGPDPDADLGLTDEEFASFLSAAHG